MTIISTLLGTEVLEVQGIAPNGQLSGQTETTTTQAIANLASLGGSSDKLSTLATAGNGTILAAVMITKNLQRTGPTIPFTDTTDTAANIIAALPNGGSLNDAFKFFYQNNTNFPVIIVGGSNVTVSGISTIPGNMAGTFLITENGLTTITMVGLALMPLVPSPLLAIATTTTNYVSSTALTVPQGLTLNIPAGTYSIHGYIQGVGPAVAGILVELTGTAGLALSFANLTGWNYNGTTLNALTNVTALSTDMAGSANAYTNVVFEGSVIISTGGELQVVTAQHTSSTATCSVVTGSYIRAIPLNA